MNKNFKKHFILFAVMTVMMIFAFVMPASAEGYCPAMNGEGYHESANFRYETYKSTCEDMGYTEVWCDVCNEFLFIDSEKYTKPTGHSYDVKYVKDGDTYTRVRTCQNDVCKEVRNEDGELIEIKTKTSIREPGYYQVKYVNLFESPETDAADHSSYYLASVYKANKPETWVLTGDKYSTDNNLYVSGKKETIDAKAATPAYEFINEDDGLKLYAVSAEAVPAYVGDTPVRGKDLVNGRYSFNGWEFATKEDGVITYNAAFKAEHVDISYTFYDGNNKPLTATFRNAYGSIAKYDPSIETPTKKGTAAYRYVLKGWSLGRGEVLAEGQEAQFGYTQEIPVYFNTDISASFEAVDNVYNITLNNNGGNIFMVDRKDENGAPVSVELESFDIICGGNFISAVNEIEKSAGNQFYVANDRQYFYDRVENTWIITEVNGNKVKSVAEVSDQKFMLGDTVDIIDKDTALVKSYTFKDGDELTLAPKYKKSDVMYTFKVSIKPTHFLSEDVYEDNSILKVDILDKFIINVYDEKGDHIKTGKTDKQGVFYFSAPYNTRLSISATMSNGKYEGSHELVLSGATYDEIQNIGKVGIIIHPRVTQAWLDGLAGCDCICHSFLSPLVVRIYNILYQFFGKKYICCDDLFITHGSVLAYTPN